MSKINIIPHQNLDFLKTEGFIKTTKNHDFTFDQLFIDYLKLYNSNYEYQNVSFEINDSQNILFCPLTIQIEKLQKSLNFFGKPFVVCQNKNQEKNFEKYLLDYFLNLMYQNKITNFRYKKYIDDTEINKYLNTSYINNLFLDKEIEIEHKISKVLSGYNENEIILVSKNPNKIGFFEKFFQLFS